MLIALMVQNQEIFIKSGNAVRKQATYVCFEEQIFLDIEYIKQLEITFNQTMFIDHPLLTEDRNRKNKKRNREFRI